MQISSCQGAYSGYSCGTFSCSPPWGEMRSPPKQLPPFLSRRPNYSCLEGRQPLGTPLFQSLASLLLRLSWENWKIIANSLHLECQLPTYENIHIIKYLCLEIEWTGSWADLLSTNKSTANEHWDPQGMFPYVEAKQMLDISIFVCIYICSYAHACTTCDVIYHTNSMHLF